MQRRYSEIQQNTTILVPSRSRSHSTSIEHATNDIGHKILLHHLTRIEEELGLQQVCNIKFYIPFHILTSFTSS